MPDRRHLTTVRFASALRDSLAERPYDASTLARDALAGLTVGVIAIPLAMALAIASGVPPQYGLYSAGVAGVVAALLGGSRFSVSGPTAAFVVILAPIAHRFGPAGLATATAMAGLLLIALGACRLGRLIEYIPQSVTLGFTTGIAVVIAVLQVGDFAGLRTAEMPEAFAGKVLAIGTALPGADAPTLAVGLASLLVVVFWPRKRLLIPGHIPALALGIGLAIALARAGHPIDTIGSRFTFDLAGGGVGHGIPRALPHLAAPWNLPGPAGGRFVLSLDTMRALIPASLSIAVLGAIESLLCAVVLDRSTGTRHHANGELLGQGVANLVAPLFGGITSTAAIARSAANVRAGARTPVAAVVHALVVLLGIVALAPVLSLVPMTSMAALLMSVAWNMSEAPQAVRLARQSPAADVLVMVVCMTLTIAFDMVVAITAGVLLASLLFMRDISRLTQVRDISSSAKHVGPPLPAGWRVFKITGALFFAAADRVLAEILALGEGCRGIVLYADGVTLLDAGGIGSLERFLDECAASGIRVVIADLQAQPREALAAALPAETDRVRLAPTLAEALTSVRVEEGVSPAA